MSFVPGTLKAQIVSKSFEEYILDHHTAKVANADIFRGWLQFASSCFGSCSEYQSHLFNMGKVSNFVRLHVKVRKKKVKAQQDIADFKSLIDSLLGDLFDNRHNFKDITFDRHKSIGEWYLNMQRRLISPQQHKKSISLKNKRINQRALTEV